MIELELLGANGDTVVLTDADGERYSVVIDDALRAAVRRDRIAALAQPADAAPTDSPVRPKDLQSLMRAGASAEEVSTATGMSLEHVRKYEGPVIAERRWAVQQAQACRIGWGKDSPVLGDLVVDRLATRAVTPASLEWDAMREGRDPWRICLTFVQGAQEKQARWLLDLSARTVTALDDEARWLTEAASPSARRPDVFDQDDAPAPGALLSTSRTSRTVPTGLPVVDRPLEGARDGAAPALDPTDALLADLASSRGRRVEVGVPDDDPAGADAAWDPTAQDPSQGEAQVLSMEGRRRRAKGSSNHPAGKRRGGAGEGRERGSDAAEGSKGPGEKGSRSRRGKAVEPADVSDPTTEVAAVARISGVHQEALPEMPQASAKPKRRARRSVPSWDEIVFGAKPE
ncbi:septation protein SepH [Actinomyces marmotae]|uniref:septation protein SepH n=1 Tax=Actinomyces marmotae TaxID=2737173 RepID=UPI00135CAC07|nr:septation protein SepH [Actinomyces marmotae]